MKAWTGVFPNADRQLDRQLGWQGRGMVQASVPDAMRALTALAVACAFLAPAAAGQELEGIGMAEPPPPASERVVTEDWWANELAGALGVVEILPEDHRVDDVYSLLCAERAELVTEAGGRRVPAQGAFHVATEVDAARKPGEPVRVVLEVPATALYQLAVEGTGLQRWAVDRRAVGHLDATALGVAFGSEVLPLREGPHELAAYMGTRSRVERVELTAFRPLCIAPADGWRSGRPLTFGAKARTMVTALRLEHFLPEDGDGIGVEGEDYTSASAWGGRAHGSAPSASKDAWATAGESPAEFAYRIYMAEPGVYSILARVHGSGPQVWSLDGRHRMPMSPGHDAQDFAWTHVMTTQMATGEHVIRALIPRGSGIDVIRVVKRRATDADYVDVLEKIGFREGASSALVTRAAAHENLSNPIFLELTRNFTGRVAGSGAGNSLVAVEDELEALYSRPLSPVLPSEL